jgi:hopanoid biosynthesis associated RND transporter like protein HpnN
VVIDGVTPERAAEAAGVLAKALRAHAETFPIVRDIQGDSFFAHDGLLFLPLNEVRDTTQHIIGAQPFLAPLAADPSVRGIMDSLSTAVLGVENGAAKLDDLTQPFNAMADVVEKTASGQPAYFSWQSLVTGAKPSVRQTRHIIEVQPTLDYSQLSPGATASDLIRKLASDLNLDPAHGVTVRLTGPVPLADEEYATLLDRAALMASLMFAAILLMLWLAVRSPKIMFAILATLFAGLVISTAVGLLVVGTFNVISVAFIPLFVGIGIDFGIQYAVRYRAERHRLDRLDDALVSAGKGMGPSLTLAAAAIAACFLSFVPTDYSGLAELGFIAGAGMMIAFLMSATTLPAVLKALNPGGEEAEIGFSWLAPADDFMRRQRKSFLVGAGILGLGGLALLPLLTFDANPLDLRSKQTESMATLLDLAKDPDTSPYTIDVLLPSLAAANDTAQKLSHVPEVGNTLTLQSFVPDQQQQKIAAISDAALLMDTTLNPFDTKLAPTPMETHDSIAATVAALKNIAGGAENAATRAAGRLADALQRLENGDSQKIALTRAAFVPSLDTMLNQLRAALAPQSVTAKTLPDDLKYEWVTTDGRARVQVFPKDNSGDEAAINRFADAVQAVAPGATGAPISTRESGRTIVRSFVQAGLLSFAAMVVLLTLFLRNARDVILTVIPLLLIGVLTFASCVALGMQLNFANIIVLPLLFGIGIAFSIYFIMSWRAGGHRFLQSSLTRAVVLSALTTATGFGTLWLSKHPGTASMGELLMIALAWTLVTTLFFVPALLEFIRPNGAE